MTIFLATGLTAGESTPMEDERIETRWFTPRELDEWIRSGKILDAKTMIGLLVRDYSQKSEHRSQAPARDGSPASSAHRVASPNVQPNGS